jgi:hypothetical protein
VREASSDRAAVPHLAVADAVRRDRQHAAVLLDDLRCRNRGMRRERPDPQFFSLDLDPVQSGNPAKVDERGRLGEPELHHRQERVATGQRPRFAVARQQPDRLVEARRAMVREFRWTLCVHGAPLSSSPLASPARHGSV